MRSLTLAHELRAHGAQVTFVCCDCPGHYGEVLRSEGFGLFMVPAAPGESLSGRQPGSPALDWKMDAARTREVIEEIGGADWVVVDHYGLDIRWERDVMGSVNQLMVIDDLANRPHACDLLLDHNIYWDPERRYEGLVPAGCRCLTGPKYALLRKEFLDAVPQRRRFPVRNLLVMFGGADATGETLKTLTALEELDRGDVKIDVVVGQANRNLDAIRERCAQRPNTFLHVQTRSVAKLMAKADLAIGAGGSTILERLWMRLPTIAVSVAQNQEEALTVLGRLGYVKYLGSSDRVGASELSSCIADYLSGEIELATYEFHRERDVLWRELQSRSNAA